MTSTQRGLLMFRLADLIARDAQKLAETEVRDNGRLLAKMLGQLNYIPQWYRHFGALADIEQADFGAISGIFAATGQTCIAGSRMRVQDSIHDAFVEKLLTVAKTARMGDPLVAGNPFVMR